MYVSRVYRFPVCSKTSSLRLLMLASGKQIGSKYHVPLLSYLVSSQPEGKSIPVPLAPSSPGHVSASNVRQGSNSLFSGGPWVPCKARASGRNFKYVASHRLGLVSPKVPACQIVPGPTEAAPVQVGSPAEGKLTMSIVYHVATAVGLPFNLE